MHHHEIFHEIVMKPPKNDFTIISSGVNGEVFLPEIFHHSLVLASLASDFEGQELKKDPGPERAALRGDGGAGGTSGAEHGGVGLKGDSSEV